MLVADSLVRFGEKITNCIFSIVFHHFLFVTLYSNLFLWALYGVYNCRRCWIQFLLCWATAMCLIGFRSLNSDYDPVQLIVDPVLFSNFLCFLAENVVVKNLF